MADIKDSGNRREFASGAVRDMADGKGRCDLLPLEQVSALLDYNTVIYNIYQYQQTNDIDYIADAIKDFCLMRGWSMPHAILELAIHFEDGARKYDEWNWAKGTGIPENSYIDSAVRHLLKYLDGMTDEPHDRAVIWNLICLWWTAENITD